MNIEIHVDQYPLNPRTEWDNLTTMAFFHKRYDLGDRDVPFSSAQFNSWGEMEAYIEKELDALYLPVYMYDHSGITISTKPFSCNWDSGQIGFVYVTKETIRKEFSCKRISKSLAKKVYDLMHGEVTIYDHYLSGDVYGYEIKDDEGEVVDSCWGYFGEDECREAANEALNNLI